MKIRKDHKYAHDGEGKDFHHKVYHHVKKHKAKLLVGLFIAVLVVLVVLFAITLSPKTAGNGDSVKVDYIGTLDDNTVFDTSIESIAKNANLFNSEREYEPLQFEIGKKNVLEDFENAVIGMKKGESKEITIKAEKAYPYDQNLVVRGIPILLTIKNSYTIGIQEFTGVVAGGKAEVGGIYILPQLPWKVKVTSIDKEKGVLSFASLGKTGDIIPMPYRSWNATITDINEQNITIKQDVAVGGVVYTPQNGIGRIVRVDGNTYDVDMNLPIAGKDLNFEMTLVEIEE